MEEKLVMNEQLFKIGINFKYLSNQNVCYYDAQERAIFCKNKLVCKVIEITDKGFLAFFGAINFKAKMLFSTLSVEITYNVDEKINYWREYRLEEAQVLEKFYNKKNQPN